MEKNVRGKGELQLVTRKYQEGNTTVPLSRSAVPKFMFITSDALKERDFETVIVGKRSVILTAAPRCDGLATESAIQLRQVVGRKQQTKLRRRVRQSWEHKEDNKAENTKTTRLRIQEQVNTGNRSVCQSGLAQLPSLPSTHTCTHSYQTIPKPPLFVMSGTHLKIYGLYVLFWPATVNLWSVI